MVKLRDDDVVDQRFIGVTELVKMLNEYIGAKVEPGSIDAVYVDPEEGGEREGVFEEEFTGLILTIQEEG